MFYGRRPKLFAKTCNGLGGYDRGKKNINGLVCDDLFEVRTCYGCGITQLDRNRSISLKPALELMVKNELSPTDAKFLSNFRKFIEAHMSRNLISYYNLYQVDFEVLSFRLERFEEQ